MAKNSKRRRVNYEQLVAIAIEARHASSAEGRIELTESVAKRCRWQSPFSLSGSYWVSMRESQGEL
jgi:hypothetical protein